MTVQTRLAQRFGTHLSPDGRWAAGPRQDGDRVALELWRDGGSHPTDLSIDPDSQVLVGSDTAYVCVSRGFDHTVWSVDRDGAATRAAVLHGRAARLLLDPHSRPWSLVFSGTHTALSPLDGEQEIRLPGAYGGGTWIGGGRLALTDTASGTATSISVDVASGEIEPLFHVGPRTNDEVQAYADGLVVVHTDAGGVDRLGYAHSGRRWLFPAELSTPDGLIEAVGIRGTQILAHLRRGVRSTLRVYDVATESARDLATPAGSLAGTPSWTPTGVAAPWTSVGVPLEFWNEAENARPTQTAPVILMPGATGPIETIVYGDWRRAPRVVLALHGGPLDAWRLAFDPFLDQLAATGTAILALNQRGSVGYGYAHAAAIREGWATADLDDVLSVGRFVAATRGRRPGIYGGSYGGYLALAAICAEPMLWSQCAVLAAFSSPRRLAEYAPPAVRAGIERSGGLSERSPDLLEVAGRARADILIGHGEYDESIPAAHARELAAAFGSRARYAEIPGVGHDLGWPIVRDLVCGFLSRADDPSESLEREAP